MKTERREHPCDYKIKFRIDVDRYKSILNFSEMNLDDYPMDEETVNPMNGVWFISKIFILRFRIKYLNISLDFKTLLKIRYINIEAI